MRISILLEGSLFGLKFKKASTAWLKIICYFECCACVVKCRALLMKIRVFDYLLMIAIIKKYY